MPTEARQLPLGIRLRVDAGFDGFVAGPNRVAVDVLQAGKEPQVFLWGRAGTGRTHLLQAACRAQAAAGQRVAYVPLSEADALVPSLLDGLEAMALIAVDDVEAVAGRQAWERSLFDLLNRARAAGTRLLFAGAAVPAACGFDLPDLVSRLGWGPVFQLRALEEAERREVVAAHARRRGLDLPPETLDYLMTRFPRDLATQAALVDRLDEASLAAQRRLTLPFVRSVLPGVTASGPAAAGEQPDGELAAGEQGQGQHGGGEGEPPGGGPHPQLRHTGREVGRGQEAGQEMGARPAVQEPAQGDEQGAGGRHQDERDG